MKKHEVSWDISDEHLEELLTVIKSLPKPLYIDIHHEGIDYRDTYYMNLEYTNDYYMNELSSIIKIRGLLRGNVINLNKSAYLLIRDNNQLKNINAFKEILTKSFRHINTKNIIYMFSISKENGFQILKTHDGFELVLSDTLCKDDVTKVYSLPTVESYKLECMDTWGGIFDYSDFTLDDYKSNIYYAIIDPFTYKVLTYTNNLNGNSIIQTLLHNGKTIELTNKIIIDNNFQQPSPDITDLILNNKFGYDFTIKRYKEFDTNIEDILLSLVNEEYEHADELYLKSNIPTDNLQYLTNVYRGMSLPKYGLYVGKIIEPKRLLESWTTDINIAILFSNVDDDSFGVILKLIDYDNFIRVNDYIDEYEYIQFSREKEIVRVSALELEIVNIYTIENSTYTKLIIPYVTVAEVRLVNASRGSAVKGF